jgi:riboflavin biosynthesis pyrimidine reductase
MADMAREAIGARLNAMSDLTDDYPWPAGRWVRALMVMTLDGGIAGPDGHSGSISGPADLRVLIAIRRSCDAVIVGAETMRVERYKPFRSRPEIAERRASAGQALAPRLVIVSASLDLPWSDPVYSESTLPPLIVAGSASDPAARERVPQTCELLVAPTPDVDPAWLLEECASRGLDRIVCEGGRRLLGSFLAADVVDEWALTLSGITRTGDFVPAMARPEDDFVFTRFVRAGQRA